MSSKNGVERVARRAIPCSIALQLSILFALTSALMLSALGVYLYQKLETELAARSEDHVRGTSQLVMHVMQGLYSADRLADDPEALGHLLVGHADMRLWVYGRDGIILFASSAPVGTRAGWESRAGAGGGTVTGLWQHSARNAYRFAVSNYVSRHPSLNDALVVVALDVSDELRILAGHRTTLWGALLLAALIASALGFFIARHGLRPLARIAQSTGRINASGLHERLDGAGVPCELKALVESFNVMLARLDDSFQRLSHFSADLAHELRTPLNSLLGRTQVALSQRRSTEEYCEVLEASVEEAERMSALISDMLFLARADHAGAALERQPVDLRKEAESLVEFFGIAAQEREIDFHVSGGAAVSGDRAMLQRALGNLLSNALRHSPRGGRIDVKVSQDACHAKVAVTDQGPGIPAEHQPRVFERFFRADPSRARESGGNGLGLAIVRSIARLHGGEVFMESAPGRPTVFHLALPRVALTAPAQPD